MIHVKCLELWMPHRMYSINVRALIHTSNFVYQFKEWDRHGSSPEILNEILQKYFNVFEKSKTNTKAIYL